MKLNNISFPYPVLGVNDDVFPLLGSDCISVSLKTAPDLFEFSIVLKQENETISRLIAEGKAEYTCEVDCPKAFLRETFTSKTSTINIPLPRRKVNGRINFNCYVSVKVPIKGYANPGFNEDYDDYTFDMEPGDILVGFPQAHFDADIRYDKLQAAGSFMVIRESAIAEQTKFDISGSKIEIVLPSHLFSLYKSGIGDRYMEIIHSSLVYNALCYALYNIQENSDTLWARSINTRIDMEPNLAKFKDLNPIEVPELAQTLLGDPYKRMMNFLASLNAQQNIEIE